MGQQVIRTPDGKLGVFSNTVEDWILWDATPDEVVDFFVEEAIADARRHAQRIVKAVVDGNARSVYFQFVRTFEEAQESRADLHGSAPWPPVEEPEVEA